MTNFLETTLALIRASWTAYLGSGTPPNPTVYVNGGEEGSYPVPASLLPEGIHPFLAGTIRDSGATEAVFTSPYKRSGPFAKQSAIATHLTTEGLTTYVAKLGNEGLGGWRLDRRATKPWGEGLGVFTDVVEALRTNARND